MSEPTNLMNTQTQVPAPIAKPVDHVALEGTNKGDHRAIAVPAVLPPQPTVRSENNDGEGA